jgi:hypothetical protein
MGESTAVTVTHHLLIEALCRRRGVLLRRLHRHPIQGQTFEFGFRVTNHGTAPFPGATIKNIEIRAGELGHSWPESYTVGRLNPHASEAFWVGPVTSLLEGPVMIGLHVASPPGADVVTYQRDWSSGRAEPAQTSKNHWMDHWFLERRLELLQARTNLLLLVIAVLTLLEGAWGLRRMATAGAHVLAGLFGWLAALFGASS